MSSSDQADIRTDAGAWLHFAGLGGSGMSGLAQFHAQAGGRATGSDRAFDQGERGDIRTRLENLGITIFPQDGSFAAAADPGGRPACDAVVVSTAVEDRVPDIAEARSRDIPLVHRSELLARYVTDHRTVAVSGTSGKSTVTAMVFTILRECGLNAGLLTGGPVTSLVDQGHIGNAWAPDPATDPRYLVIEADESDGSLVRYHPWAGVILNLGLDHKPPAEIMAMFEVFRGNVGGPLIVGAEANLAGLAAGAEMFGVGDGDRPGTWARKAVCGPDGSDFEVDGVAFHLPVPGRYNVTNAAAALAAGRACGLSLERMAPALAGFRGVSRRFQRVGEAGGVEVIDDFAHNPDKIAAALAAARGRLASSEGRVLAVFQPHGYGPTRFLRDALVDAFAAGLESADVLWLPEIYFAGGSVTRDISSADLVGDIRRAGRDARFLESRGELPPAVAAEARPGDLVLVMGARDPSLTDFCRTILGELERNAR